MQIQVFLSLEDHPLPKASLFGLLKRNIAVWFIFSLILLFFFSSQMWIVFFLDFKGIYVRYSTPSTSSLELSPTNLFMRSFIKHNIPGRPKMVIFNHVHFLVMANYAITSFILIKWILNLPSEVLIICWRQAGVPAASMSWAA